MPKLKVYFNPENSLSVNIEGMGVYVAEQEYAKLKVENKNQAELLQKLGEANLNLKVELTTAEKSLTNAAYGQNHIVEQLKEQNQLMLTALQRIALWDEHDVKTRVDIDSMGQQRHYRAIAADAVLGQPCNVTAIKMKAVDDFGNWLTNTAFFDNKHHIKLNIFKATNQYLSDLSKADSNSVGKSAEGGKDGQ